MADKASFKNLDARFHWLRDTKFDIVVTMLTLMLAKLVRISDV